MDSRYLGDAFDYYKRWFLLEACGSQLRKLRIFPMPVDGLNGDPLSRYASLLGVSKDAVVQTSATPRSRRREDRAKYFANAMQHSECDVFLDPNTGLFCGGSWRQKNPSNYVLTADLIALLPEGTDRLAVVYDQSLARGGELVACRSKLAALREEGFSGLAYCAQVAMLVVARPEGEARLDSLSGRIANHPYVPPARLLASSCRQWPPALPRRAPQE